jgi:hypothetical protein
MKKTLQTITAGLTALAVLAIFQTVPTHAASFSVSTGNDENTDNLSCSLSEAIENINDQAATNTDCPAGDGVNDTINLPAGTITLVTDLPTLTKTTTIKGAGMGDSIIDGDGQYKAVSMLAAATETLSVADFTVTGFKGIAVGVENSNFNVNRVEADGTNSTGTGSIALVGFGAQNTVASTNISVSINNSHVHQLNGSVSGMGIIGIFAYTSDDASLDLSMSNVTLNDIQNTDPDATAAGVLAMGGIITGGSSSVQTADLENITTTNVQANAIAIGIGVLNYTGVGNASSVMQLHNSTITDINGGNNPSAPDQSSRGMFVGGGGASGSATVALNINNVLLSDIGNAGVPAACGDPYDYTPGFGGSGSFAGSITSTGGNLSSDNTCTSYFTHPKDQNNLTNLGSTLGSLQNNGGIVPTRALLNGSPAIDSGITIPGLTQDARGSVRPQGLAYDSGAYESPFTTAQSSTPVKQAAQTLADTGESRRIFILCAVLVVLTSLSVIVAIKRQKKPQK